MTTNEYLTIFSQHRMYIFYFCKKILNDQENAEDITSEAFITLWHNAHNIPMESAKSYLMVTSHRKCFDLLRRNKRYLHALNKTPTLDLEEVRIESGVLDHIYKIIDSLPPQQKKMILYKYNRGLKVKDISKLLKLSPQTTSNTLNTALKYIRTQIKNRGIGPG